MIRLKTKTFEKYIRLIQAMSELFGQARRAEARGDLADAALLFAQDGLIDLVESSLGGERKRCVDAAILLRAVSCDVREGNEVRAAFVFDIVRLLLEEVQEMTDDATLGGLVCEWLGDGALMLGSMEALEYYSSAEAVYRDIEVMTAWGYEEEYDYADAAVKGFLEANGFSLDDEFREYFVERVRRKQEIAEALLKGADS